MEFIKELQAISKKDVSLAGGKGASLGELINAGVQVPRGFVITASTFEKFISDSGLKNEIDSKLKQVDVHDVNDLTKTSAILRDAIHDTEIPKEVSEEILQKFQELHVPFVAVRSSATAEDSDIASWAGELDTFLNTSEEHLIENVKKCWSSLFTPRAIFYRHEKNLIDHNVSVAVVVQEMIQSEISGVAFTVHPVTENRNEMIIEACFGLGEAIVSGQVTPDTYIVEKKEMNISSVHTNTQEKKLSLFEHKNKWIALSEQDGAKQKLSFEQIIELSHLCKKIEDHYGFPCDIEWAFANNTFYMLQSRPITTLKKR